jgi:hypothetical protein
MRKIIVKKTLGKKGLTRDPQKSSKKHFNGPTYSKIPQCKMMHNHTITIIGYSAEKLNLHNDVDNGG